MDFEITSVKVLGTPSEKGWVQVHDFSPKDDKKKKLRGHLFALIVVKLKAPDPSRQEIETVSTGREILTRIHEEYFGKLDSSAFRALQKAAEKVALEFSSLGEVQIVAASVVASTLYTAIAGGGEVSIFRKGALATILKVENGKSVSASGFPEDGDLFLLTTKDFYDVIGRGVINATISNNNLEEIAETVAPKLHSISKSTPGLAVIKFNKRSVIKKVLAKEEKEPISAKIEIPKEKVKKRMNFVKNILTRRKIKVRKREIDVEDLQKKKTTMSVSVALLGLLFVSIFFGIRQKGVREKSAVTNEKISEARHNLDEAKALFSLNPDRARELFFESKKIVEELQEGKVKGDEVDEIVEEVKRGRESILGEYEAEEELFLDLSPVSDGFSADFMASSSDNLAILDESGKKVVVVSIGTKHTEIVSGPAQLRNPTDISIYESRIFVFEDDAIFEVGDSKIEHIEDSWKGEIIPYAYAGNFYVLDKGSSEIIRYAGDGRTFSSGRSWLAPGIEPDLSKIVSITIDGAIWILSSSGRIEKYLHGSPQTLNVSVTPEIVNPSHIYTNEDLESVYVLDPGNSRIVVIGKEGEYKAQYLSDKLRNASHIAVSEKERIIIFLSENKLFSIEIKH